MDVSTNKHNCYISINVKDLKQTCPFWNNHLSRSLWISRVHVFSASHTPLQASRLARLSPTLVGGRHAHPSRTGAPSPGRADPGAASAERRNVVGKGVDEKGAVVSESLVATQARSNASESVSIAPASSQLAKLTIYLYCASGFCLDHASSAGRWRRRRPRSFPSPEAAPGGAFRRGLRALAELVPWADWIRDG